MRKAILILLTAFGILFSPCLQAQHVRNSSSRISSSPISDAGAKKSFWTLSGKVPEQMADHTVFSQAMSNMIEVCPTGGQAVAVISDLPSVTQYTSFKYYFWDESGLPCIAPCLPNQIPFSLDIPQTGQPVFVMRRYMDGEVFKDSTDVWVFVSPLVPVISASVSPASDCWSPSGSIAVSDISGNHGDVRRIFRLFNPSGLTIQSNSLSQSSYTFSGLAPGSYTIQISTGCSTTEAQVVVPVSTNLQAGISGPLTVCAGTSATLTADGGGTYQWSTGATSKSVSVAPALPGNYTYSVTITNGYCSDVRSHTLTVNPLPAASIEGPSQVCANTGNTLSASGGVNYSWSSGQTSPSITINISSPVSYMVTVTNDKGCQNIASKTVAPFTIPQISGVTKVCQGGAAYLVINQAATSFQWSTGATNSSTTVYPAGTTNYTVTVTDVNNCTNVISHQIAVDVPSRVQITGPASICLGDTVTLGAYGSYDNQWNTGQTYYEIKVSPAQNTTYTLTGRDHSNYCQGRDTLEIIVIPRPDATVEGPSQICSGQQATLTAVDWGSGNGNLSYQWSTYAYSPSIVVSPTAAQTTSFNYRVTVTNQEGCSVELSKNITVYPAVHATVTPDLSLCAGDSAILTASGGSTYRWSTGATSASIKVKPLQSATYTVTVSNGAICSDTGAVNVTVYTTPGLSIQGPVQICAGQSATLIASGGQSYAWNTGATTPSIQVSPGATTTYTVTSGLPGCAASKTHEVQVNPPPSGVVQGPASICPGQPATLTASGGTSYRWSPGNFTDSSITVSPSQTTDYSVTIANSEGCSVVKTHSLSVGFTGAISNDGPITCLKSSALLKGTVSVPGVAFSWKNAAGTVLSVTDSLQVSSPGTYYLTLSTPDSCSVVVSSQVLSDLAAPTGSASALGQITCSASSVLLQGSSSTPGVTYQWRNSGGTVISSAQNFGVSQPGTYTLKISGANGCFIEKIATVSAGDLNPPNLTVKSNDTLTCTKTSLVLTASSSTPGATFQWKNAAGAVISNSPDATVSTAGVYEVKAMGPNGCSAIGYTHVIQIGSLPTISASNNGPITCYPVMVNGSSTTPGVTYEWRNQNDRVVSTQASFEAKIPGIYTLKVIAPNGCSSSAATTVGNAYTPPDGSEMLIYFDGQPAGSGNYFTRNIKCQGDYFLLQATSSTGSPWFYLSDAHFFITEGNSINYYINTAGVYYVRMYNADGCEVVKEIHVKYSKPKVQITGNLNVCYGTTTSLNASGWPIYSWSTGSDQSSIQTGYLYSNTTYSVTATDWHNCKDTGTVTVLVNPSLATDAQSNLTICSGNSITIGGNTTGGTAPHSYQWSTGATTRTIAVSPASTKSYTVTVTDSKGCTLIKSVKVTVKSSPTVSISSPDAICPGQSATLAASGGGTYSWSTEATASSITVSPAATTTYTVTVTGSNGCKTIASRTIAVHETPLVSITGPGTVCQGLSATLQAEASGGGGGFTYAWNTGQTAASISTPPLLNPATYQVTATSAYGCTASASQTLSPAAAPQLTLSGGSSVCAGESVGLVASANQAVHFLWSTGAYQAAATSHQTHLAPLSTEAYSVTATNAAGCKDTATWAVTVHPKPTAAISALLANCFGETSTLNASGGASFLWSTGSVSPSLVVAPTQTTAYAVTVTNAEGCAASDSIRVPVPPPFTLSYTLDNHLDCTPGNVVVWPLPSGAQGPVAFTALMDGIAQPNPPLSGLSAGAFTLQAIDSKGCMASVGVEIEEHAPLQLTYALDNPEDCIPGNAKVQIDVIGNREAVDIYRMYDGAIWYDEGSFSPGSVFTVASGVHAFYGLDSLQCADSLSVALDEDLMRDLEVVQKQLDDCYPANTLILAAAHSPRGSISFNLDGGAWQTDPGLPDVPPGAHFLHFQDALGCQDSLFFFVEDESVLPAIAQDASHCDTADAEVLLPLIPSDTSAKYLYSLDHGATWQDSYQFTGLAPGAYRPAIKKLPAGCVVTGDTLIVSDTCAQTAIAGFTADTLIIRSPDQLARFFWTIRTPAWIRDSFALQLVLAGSGAPHFAPFAADTVLEKSGGDARVFARQTYYGGYAGPGEAQIPLADSSGQFLYPQEYLFELETLTPEKLLIDPQRKQLRVLAALGPFDYEEENLIVCAGDPVALDAGPGNCYLWDDGSASNPRTVTPLQNAQYSVTVLDAQLRPAIQRFYVKTAGNNGPCCDYNSDEILQVLNGLGFVGFPCAILDQPGIRQSMPPFQVRSGNITDYAQLHFLMQGISIDPNQLLSDLLNTISNRGFPGNGYITKNENLSCSNNLFNEIKNRYEMELNDYDIWYHIWDNPIEGEDDFVFIRCEKFEEIQSIAGVTAFPASNGNFKWLDKATLKDYVRSKYCTGCSDGQLENMTGKLFEEVWHQYAISNFNSFGWNYQSNTAQFFGIRNTVPDGISNSICGRENNRVIFPESRWYEVKAKGGTVYNSTSSGQIASHIIAMRNEPIIQPALQANCAILSIITTSDCNVAASVYRKGTLNRIEINHWYAQYFIDNLGRMKVQFKIFLPVFFGLGEVPIPNLIINPAIL